MGHLETYLSNYIHRCAILQMVMLGIAEVLRATKMNQCKTAITSITA